jgi:hypothetical protein
MSQIHYLPLTPGFFAILVGIFIIVLILLGVPFLTLRTCRVAVLRSTCSHLKSVNSEARRPCL